MQLLDFAKQLVSAARELVTPRYRPELHYMRGPRARLRAPRGLRRIRRVLPALRRERV